MDQRRHQGPRRFRLLGLTSIPLALSLRTLAALAAATVALGGGAAVLVSAHVPSGATNHAAATGAEPSDTPDPSESPEANDTGGAGPTGHGLAVVSAVASCKAARPSPGAGSRGIGECVSTVASGGHEGGHGDTGTGNGNSGAAPATPAHPTPHGPSH